MVRSVVEHLWSILRSVEHGMEIGDEMKNFDVAVMGWNCSRSRFLLVHKAVVRPWSIPMPLEREESCTNDDGTMNFGSSTFAAARPFDC